MIKVFDYVWDKSGNVIPGVKVSLLATGGAVGSGAPVDIFADKLGTLPIDYATTQDKNAPEPYAGSYELWVAPGEYTMKFEYPDEDPVYLPDISFPGVGGAGEGFRYRPGGWDADTAYLKNDVTSLGGSGIYVALQDNTGQVPGSAPLFWEAMITDAGGAESAAASASAAAASATAAAASASGAAGSATAAATSASDAQTAAGSASGAATAAGSAATAAQSSENDAETAQAAAETAAGVAVAAKDDAVTAQGAAATSAGAAATSATAAAGSATAADGSATAAAGSAAGAATSATSAGGAASAAATSEGNAAGSEAAAAGSAIAADASADTAAGSATAADASADAAEAALAVFNGPNMDIEMRDANDLNAIFNSPNAMTQIAKAIKNGAATVVIVGDSLTFGYAGPANASLEGIVSRALRKLFPAVVWTFKNRAIPGAMLDDFLSATYHPADNPYLGTGGAAGTPGREAWSPAQYPEQTYRWPEGAASFVATTWRDVVQADAPDLLLFGLGLNDIWFNGQTLKDVRSNLAGLGGFLGSWEKVPSVVLLTEHTGNPLTAGPVPLDKRDIARGLSQYVRLAAKFYNFGVLDVARAYDRHLYGIDPLRIRFDQEDFLAGIADANAWEITDLTSSPGAAVVTDAGLATMVLDTTGKYAGPGHRLYMRKVQTNGFNARFNIRKLASANDYVVFVLAGPREGNPFGTAKLSVVMSNVAGLGRVNVIMDNVSIAMTDLAVPFPDDDTEDFFCIVRYDGATISVWAGSTDTNVPDVSVPTITHTFGWAGLGYGDFVAAPQVKLEDVVLGFFKLEPAGLPRVTAEQIFNTVSDFGTNPLSTGGDAVGQHPSTLGQQLMYEQPLQPVLAAIAGAAVVGSTIAGGVFIITDAVFTLSAAHNTGFISAAFAGVQTLTVPSPTTVPGLPIRFSVWVQYNSSGQLVLNPADVGALILGEPDAKGLNAKWRMCRLDLVGITPFQYQWAVFNPRGQNHLRNFTTGAEFFSMGAKFDGSDGIKWMPTSTTAVILSCDTATGQYDVFVDTGLVVGTTYTPTRRFSLPVNAAKTLAALFKLYGPDGAVRGGILTFNTTGNVGLCFGMDHDGTNYIARSTTAVMLLLNTATTTLEVYANSALTVGNSFSPTKRFGFVADGRIYTVGLHNNAGGAAGAVEYIQSGTYTPTFTNVANLTTMTALGTWKWQRVGNVVTVGGLVTLDATAAATNTVLGISPPIASNFGSNGDASGTGASPAIVGASGASGGVYANAAADRLELRYQATLDPGAQVWCVHAIYEVLP